MKRITLTSCLLLLLATVTNLYAQGDDASKAYMEFMTPGAMHKWMGKLNGNWEVEMTSQMNPAAP